MKRLRSTTFWANVPNQTDAAMNSTRATIAPKPAGGGSGIAGAWASRSSMTGLPAPSRPVCVALLVPQVLVAHDVARHDERQRGACRPGDKHAKEDPVGNAQHERQRIGIALITECGAEPDGIDAGGQPDQKDDDRLAAAAAQDGIF